MCLYSLIHCSPVTNVHTQDAVLMGRLIGIPYFLLPQAHDNKKANATTLRKVKKEVLEIDDNYFPSKNNLVCCIHINASLRMQKQFEGPYHFYVDYRMACAFTLKALCPKSCLSVIGQHAI